MIKKTNITLSSFVFLTILLAILFVPQAAFSQGTPGCCINPIGYCSPGQQTFESECDIEPDSLSSFVAGQKCNDQGIGCERVRSEDMGCCRISNICADLLTRSDCESENGDVFIIGKLCNVDASQGCTEVGVSDPGCCSNFNDPNMCMELAAYECVYTFFGAFSIEGTCQGNGQCNPPPPTPPDLIGAGDPTSVPAFSQWGLLLMAGILGLAGFILLHRRKASA